MTKGEESHGKHSVEKSHINRNGLPAKTVAPAFHLPRLDGGAISLEVYRGQNVLLVFSDPSCGPCNALAPRLQQIHRDLTDLEVLMVSRGDPEANRVKVVEHGITFPVVLQRHWDLSRHYGIFATPIAYLIDAQGVIAADVAVGVDAILALAAKSDSLRRSVMKEMNMSGHLETRLVSLKQEMAKGEAELDRLVRQQSQLRDTVLRIAGAIQVLEELLVEGQPVEQNGSIGRNTEKAAAKRSAPSAPSN